MKSVYSKEKKEFYISKCETAVKALRSREFDAMWFGSSDEAVKKVLEIIPDGLAVGAGGSVTLQETGILDSLSKRGSRVIHHDISMGLEKTIQIRKEANACSYYLTGSNAITMDGDLVNIDGVGNRVAAMSFGPGVVIAVAGANKLVPDIHEALSRIKNVATPINARRVGIDSPCVKAGKCLDCHTRESICRVTTIISQKPMFTDFKVILIAEDLGF
ncbi:MAG: lactate utilization protein [Actinobacteria bacterium]|nr:lactate utilization protein [Actinomycetota bacterium]